MKAGKHSNLQKNWKIQHMQCKPLKQIYLW